MKTQKKFILLTTLIFLIGLASLTYARFQPTYAIVNCKIFPVSGPPIEKGTIVIRDGLIEALGSTENVTVPEDAEVIEAEGLFAYPGLIDAHTNFFLQVKRPTAPSTRGSTTPQPTPKQHPEFEALDHLKFKKTTLDKLHKIGITTILIAPQTGVFAGQSVLLNLNGETIEPMVVVHPFALHVNFTTVRGGYPTSIMGTVSYLRQSFLDTQHYARHKSLFAASANGLKRPVYDPFLETLIPFVVKRRPVVFNCANLEDIKRALRLIKEFKLNGFLAGGNEAWRVRGLVKEAKTPLLVSLDFKPPFTSSFANQGSELKERAEKEIYPANAANLHQEGVTFALASSGLKTSDILKNIQKAIEKGLPQEEALKAMTLTPAQYLGVDNILGSLEAGKIANIVLTSEEIFGKKAQVRRVFVDGQSFEIKQPPKEAKKPTTLNLTGQWDATLTGTMGKMEFTMNIEQDGNQISGKMVSDFGEWTISDGVLSGKEITFTITGQAMGRTVDLAFGGQAEEDSIEGTVTIMGSPAELRARRSPGSLG